MLTRQTMETLRSLNLRGMAEAYEQQLCTGQKLNNPLESNPLDRLRKIA
jgi:hypothetical protein